MDSTSSPTKSAKINKAAIAISLSRNDEQTESVSRMFCTLAFACLFDLILYVPSTIFQLYRDGSSWVEPVIS